MIVILRNNQKLLRRRNPFRRGVGFERLRDDYRKFSKGKVDSKPLSKQELQKIRKRVIQENRKDNIRTWGIGIVVTFMAIIITLLGYRSIQTYEAELDEIKIEKSTNKYLFYIQDGDKWLEKGNYQNAVFQYLLAKQIYSSEYNVNYRLALAYGSWCKYEQTGCNNAKSILAKLKSRFPNKPELRKLEELLPDPFDKNKKP